MTHPVRSLSRAAIGGLVLGLVGSAFVLLYAGWTNAHRPCEFPGTAQCEMELSLGEHLARLQSYAAIGCALVAGGVFLFTRRRP